MIRFHKDRIYPGHNGVYEVLNCGTSGGRGRGFVMGTPILTALIRDSKTVDSGNLASNV